MSIHWQIFFTALLTIVVCWAFVKILDDEKTREPTRLELTLGLTAALAFIVIIGQGFCWIWR